MRLAVWTCKDLGRDILSQGRISATFGKMHGLRYPTFEDTSPRDGVTEIRDKVVERTELIMASVSDPGRCFDAYQTLVSRGEAVFEAGAFGLGGMYDRYRETLRSGFDGGISSRGGGYRFPAVEH